MIHGIGRPIFGGFFLDDGIDHFQKRLCALQAPSLRASLRSSYRRLES